MNTADTYEKVYFNDSYQKQFEAFRNHYRARTRKALQGRRVDHAPVPNATEVVFLHNDPNGGTLITTGDFVEYFNRRFGDNDRIGAARRSLANAVRKAESCRDIDKKRAAAIKKSEQKVFAPRSAKPKFAFAHAIFAMLLLLAIGLWGGSTLYLNHSESYVMEVEERYTLMELNGNEQLSLDAEGLPIDASDEVAIFMSMGAADQVEAYPTEEPELPALLSLFFNLGKKD